MQRHFSLLSAIALLGSCGGDSESLSGEALVTGEASAALGAASNEAACTTCHAVTVGTGLSGAPLKDIAFRTSFKGGDAPTLLDGVNACIGGWMGGTVLTESDDRWKALEAYLVSISSSAVTAPNSLSPEVLANEAAYEAAYQGGSAAAGAAKYATFCSGCHDKALVVGPAPSPSKANLKLETVGRIAQKVRTSGPPPSGSSDATDSTPGPMPFFEPDELSSQDLKDIIAFVRQ